MKLSKILKDWPGEKLTREERIVYGLTTVGIKYAEGYNTALTSCDREIDREALANHISNALCDCKQDPITGEGSQCRFCYDIKGYEKDLADAIISTMPTWLKPIGRK